MPVTEEQMLEWLHKSAPTWHVTQVDLSAAFWGDEDKRVEYLCDQAALRFYYLYDEPGAPGTRRVYFGSDV